MIDLLSDPDDDGKFIERIAGLISGMAAVHKPKDVIIYKIDHWFDHKWLGYPNARLRVMDVWSGKLIGLNTLRLLLNPAFGDRRTHI